MGRSVRKKKHRLSKKQRVGKVTAQELVERINWGIAHPLASPDDIQKLESVRKDYLPILTWKQEAMVFAITNKLTKMEERDQHEEED